MIKIVLCDDHKLIRLGVTHILKEYPELELLEAVANSELLFKHLRELKPDVLILDIALPGRNGLDILIQVKNLYPNIHVLVLSMFPEEKFGIRMLKAGASGYVHKDCEPEDLVKAIKSVAHGKQYFGEKIPRLLFEELIGENDKLPHEILSDREFEVLLHLGNGKTISEIANILLLSVKTISTYRSRILEKMRMGSNAELANYLLVHDLL